MTLYWLPPFAWCLFVFLIGLGIGSFLNVVVARMPFEKSVIWPGSHCGHCLGALKWYDNLPLLGWLRLRGRCRFCGTYFSSRYFWVELLVGLAFVALFVFELLPHMRIYVKMVPTPVVESWHAVRGIDFDYTGDARELPARGVVYFGVHALFLSFLIGAALIDLEHKIIPAQLTYVGTVLGLLCSTLLPWPWPAHAAEVMQAIPADQPWYFAEVQDRLPMGVMPWPFWGPTPESLPMGSHALGFVNGLVGALVGTFLVRAVKGLFEVGMNREALGLGDADLMMMAGAFLGWQVVVLGFFLGAIAGLVLWMPIVLWNLVRGTSSATELPFGPGLAVGIVGTWLAWPFLGEFLAVLFDPIVLGVLTTFMGGGLLAAGMLLRRPPEGDS